MEWNTACLDWEHRIMSGKSLIPDLPLFDGQANRALRIFKRLRLPDVPGKPTMAEAFGDWVFDLVRVVFGSYDPVTKRRMIQEYFLLIPKKNGKSTVAAAIMVVALVVNPRPRGEFLLIAPTKEIADIAYGQAEGMIKLDRGINKKFKVTKHQRTITHLQTDAELKIKAADTDVITGSKAVGILVDETHVFAKKASAKDIFVELRGGLAARPDGFMIQITTQSKEPPSGVFKSELALARDIRDGKVQMPALPVLYELPVEVTKDGGWKDEKTWALVNPNLNRSVDLQFLKTRLTAAERDTDSDKALKLLASQHFNVQIGLAMGTDAWIGAQYWEAAADPTLTLDALIDRSEVAVIGIDGGGLDDLLGAAVIGRCKSTRDWLHWSHAWAQEDVFKRRKEIVPKLEDLISLKELTRCTTPTQDIDDVVELAVRLRDAGLLPDENAIGLDPQAVAAIVDALAEKEIEQEQMIGISQGYRLSGAVWGTERKLKDGTFWHCGQPLMDWCVGNAKVEQRGNAVLITKQAAGKAKIDPLVASFNAVALMSRKPEPPGPRVVQVDYASGGMFL